ncbi:LRR receptor-like serine/threonine-protein kinase RPK2 [Malania oleifera]|uniref:LRR receptor-like serine/threonine-protein kinase RPK2 n=1 Tax=Malania oleifera TaxID=397392 RepID=UPI0025AE7A3D|nr:LRR receptor-like serine/threonine-protein kinase RPK2 [Malania oleifera]
MAFGFSEQATSVSTDAMSLLSFKSSVSLTIAFAFTPLKGPNNSFPSVLAGTLTASVGNLTELQTLSLPHNAFSGEIPPELGKLRLLEVLELQGNNFSGCIPAQISLLSSLRVLNLSYNALSGSIPDKLIGYGKVRVIDLSNNHLSSGIKVEKMTECKFLTHLKLSHNLLINNIPREIGKCRNLKTLLLDGNVLEGRIPAEIGKISELRVLDVSRNSLTNRIPKELSNCKRLSVIVLTNLVDLSSENILDDSRGEFNAYVGGVPSEVLLLPNLQIFWAPRANLGGKLPSNWSNLCSLRVLNLGQNYFTGVVPQKLGMCKNLTFLDLSSNDLRGYLHPQLRVPCMVYFNISRNSITGILPAFENGSCGSGMISYGKGSNSLDEEDIQHSYNNIPVWDSQMSSLFKPMLGEKFALVHDLSWNRFFGSLPLFSLGDQLLGTNHKSSYRLVLNNNVFNGSLPHELVSNCNDLKSFSVNLSANQLSGGGLPLNCLNLRDFEAADNQIDGSIGPGIGNLTTLQCLDMRNNRLSGSLPDQLGMLKDLRWILLGGNNLSGEISTKLDQLTSLIFLDLSKNALTGSIPASLTNATNLQVVLLDHNRLFGEIPSSFSTLSSLTQLNVSFNNLSGHIPRLQHPSNCNCFKGNRYLHSCPDVYSASPVGLPVPHGIKKRHNRSKWKSFVIPVTTSVSVIICGLLVMVLYYVLGRRKISRLTSLRKKMVVTFADVPTELNYDSIVRATGNFSIRNLIGRGGFGSTYKAELVPGFLVAVKRLSIGRFQGFEQFDAEIRTLGRIRHKNLVTLIGHYVGEAEMFLIYNYLSGGNLETFIHHRSEKNVQWPVIHKIAIDVAQALAYLHYSCVPRIVHRDIKPSNILLDEELNAYLSDFGLARLLEVSETHATTDVAGTFGYVAPEYATTCRVSDKSDVYSFGVVLLELMSGKKSLDPSFSEYGNGFNIVAWAKLLIREGRSSVLFRTELWEAGPRENLMGMLRLASVCTVESLAIRPSMKHVVEKLKQLKS